MLEKYKEADSTSRQDQLYQATQFKPEWEKYGLDQASVPLLRLLHSEDMALKTKDMMTGDINIMQACLAACSVQEPKVAQWVLGLFYNMLREDASCYNVFDQALKHKLPVLNTFLVMLDKSDSYVCDTAAWILTAVMGHAPGYFTEGDVAAVLKKVVNAEQCTGLTESGALEALVNLLKADKFRRFVYSSKGVVDKIFFINVTTATAPVLYKSVFAIWLLTFDDKFMEETTQFRVVQKVLDILTARRVEKVVRMCLTALRNLMTHKVLCEEMVELGLLGVVQGLEFEKWRDAELYDDIRDISMIISNKVSEMSNFDRYEKELERGILTWSSVHTSKFWGENVLKFDQHDSRALKVLATLLMSSDTDPTTLAVACHDVGEFVALHPLGKKKIAQLGIKDSIMDLMGSNGDHMKDVRREALLCCQKIMLNKWQEVGADKSK